MTTMRMHRAVDVENYCVHGVNSIEPSVSQCECMGGETLCKITTHSVDWGDLGGSVKLDVALGLMLLCPVDFCTCYSLILKTTDFHTII